MDKNRIIDGTKIEENIYKITDITERLQNKNAPSNLAVIGRCILTPDIFDKISETEVSLGEVHLSDVLKKLDSLYGIVFEGKSYYIETDWNGSRHQSNSALTMMNLGMIGSGI